jgi:chromosome segregation ATPase
MRQEYALDKIIQYAIDETDDKVTAVNREYSNIEYRIKKMREKLARRKAKLYDLQQEPAENKNEKSTANETGKWMKKQLELMEEIQFIEEEIEKNITVRKATPYRIPVAQMPQESRYCKLHQESKHFQNIIKMICYRAETAFANQLAPFYARKDDEIRALIKAVIYQTIDLFPDYDRKLLNITLYPLANQRANRAIASLIDKINDTNTIYPGTDLLMKFKITTL